MHRFSRLRPACLAMLSALVLGSALAAPHVGAAPSAARTAAPGSALTWSKPRHIDSASTLMASVSCANPTFCMAMDTIGNAFTWNGRAWSGPVKVDQSGGGSYFISCPSRTFCAEVGGSTFSPDGGGNASIWHGRTWSRPAPADPGYRVTGFSCASATFCVAVDDSGHAVTWNGKRWSEELQQDLGVENPTGAGLIAVSCAGAGFCSAVANDQSFLLREGQEGWSNPMPMIPFTSDCASHGGRDACFFGEAYMSCPSDHFCLMVDNGGDAIVWNGQTWSAAPISAHFNGVSCAGARFCVAVDDGGHAFTWNGARWSKATADPPGPLNALAAVSCPTASFCVAVDNNGSAIIGRVA